MTAPTRPEPVLRLGQLVAQWQRITAAVIALVLAVGAVVVLAGWATQGEVENWARAVGGICGGEGTLLGILLPLLGAQQATEAAAVVREQVTPIEAPQNSDGHALVDAVEVYGEHAAKRLITSEDVSTSMGPDLP